MNNILRFDVPVELQAAAAVADGQAKVSIRAYTGDAMRLAGWSIPVVVDTSGLNIASGIPLLVDHDASIRGTAGVGTARVDRGQVLIDGVLAVSTEAGAKVRDLLRAGIPLKASIGARVLARRSVKPGDGITVNGRVITAGKDGLNLVTSAELYECSILPIAADSSSQVSLIARAIAMNEVDSTEATTTTTTEAAEALRAERARVAGIRAACGPENRGIEDRAITENWTIEATSTACLAALRASRASAAIARPPGGTVPGGKPRDHLACAALLMAHQDGIAVKAFGARAAETISRPHGWADLAALALQCDGRDVPSDRNELLKAGFSTISMPYALGASMQKVGLDAFVEMSATWRAMARIVAAKNFLDGKVIRLSPATRLLETPADGEIKHGHITEDAYDFRVKTYSRMFQLTRQDIINDDISILSDLPRVMGAESARTVSDAFFDMVIANAGSFFGPGNANILHASLGITELASAIELLRTRTDSDGRIIGFTPSTLVVPAALEFIGRGLLNSSTIARDTAAADLRPMGNPIPPLDLQVEPRLDADSQTDWYLTSKSADAPFLVAFLDGVEGARVETQDAPFNTFGMQLRAYMDFGVALGDYRAAVKSDVTPYS